MLSVSWQLELRISKAIRNASCQEVANCQGNSQLAGSDKKYASSQSLEEARKQSKVQYNRTYRGLGFRV